MTDLSIVKCDTKLNYLHIVNRSKLQQFAPWLFQRKVNKTVTNFYYRNLENSSLDNGVIRHCIKIT